MCALVFWVAAFALMSIYIVVVIAALVVFALYIRNDDSRMGTQWCSGWSAGYKSEVSGSSPSPWRIFICDFYLA